MGYKKYPFSIAPLFARFQAKSGFFIPMHRLDLAIFH
jgi:hypothetical protein